MNRPLDLGRLAIQRVSQAADREKDARGLLLKRDARQHRDDVVDQHPDAWRAHLVADGAQELRGNPKKGSEGARVAKI